MLQYLWHLIYGGSLQALFKEQADAGEVHARMLWREWLEQHKEVEAYQAVLKQTGSTPRNLFEDLVEKLQPKFDEERKVRVTRLRAHLMRDRMVH